MTTQTADPAIIKLDNVRLSFPALFTARAVEGSEPRFSASFLMDNEKHKALIAKIQTTIDRLALDHFKKKVVFKSCLHDGSEKEDKEGYGDGVMYINASRKTRPAVVNRDVSPLTEADGVVYAGCYVNATIRLWVQDNKFGKRVNAELRAVQYYGKGDAFGAGPVKAEDEFTAVEDGGDDI